VPNGREQPLTLPLTAADRRGWALSQDETTVIARMFRPGDHKWPVPFYVRWDLVETTIGKSWRFHSATDQNGRQLEFVEVVAWLRG
jgi:hypothetical protein